MGKRQAAGEAPHTGTTIVAIQYDGGVVVGADSRVSTGAHFLRRCRISLSVAAGMQRKYLSIWHRQLNA